MRWSFVVRKTGDRNLLGLLFFDRSDDVTVSWIDDAHDADTVVFTACGTEGDVVTFVVLDGGLGKKSVVFDFRLSERWGVVGQHDELGFTVTESLQGCLVTKLDLSGFHHKGKLGVDPFSTLFLF